MSIHVLPEKVLIILHFPTSDFLLFQNFFSISLKVVYVIFAIKCHAFYFLQEPECGRKRDISQSRWQCYLESDGGGVGKQMGPDAEMSNMSWRCCCQLSEEASRIYAFFFLKLRRQFSEIAMENTRPTSTPWKSKEISLLGNDDVPGR